MLHDRFLKMREAQALANVSRPTMRRWCEEGLIRAAKLPGRGDWRIQEGSLLAFLAGENVQMLAVDHIRRLGL